MAPLDQFETDAGGISDANMVVCRNVWKLFGTDAQCNAALAAMEDGDLDRKETAERFGCVLAVADVSFSIRRGEVFCVMGLSGSGKSTLVRHLNRLITPSRGTILIDGEDIGQKSPVELRHLRASKISMVFQDMALWPHKTVRQNVSYGLEVLRQQRECIDKTVREYLELVQLADWGDRYPDELSGGMKQRVGLARALATNPDILLMDEPFSALDPLIRQQLQAQFLRIVEKVNKTVVFITHDLQEAMLLGDRVAIMKDGRLIQVGTPEDIVMRPREDYVREFVRGMPKYGFIRADNVMERMQPPYNANARWEGFTRVSEDATLDALVGAASESKQPLVVVNHNQVPIGTIGFQTLLDAIRGAISQDDAVSAETTLKEQSVLRHGTR